MLYNIILYCCYNYTINASIQVYLIYLFFKSLMHQFKCVDNAINVHEFIFNILSFIHVLLIYISIPFFHSQIHTKSFQFYYFNYVTFLFQLHTIIFVHGFFGLIIHLSQSFIINLAFIIFLFHILPILIISIVIFISNVNQFVIVIINLSFIFLL